jgi:hypothetical protein
MVASRARTYVKPTGLGFLCATLTRGVDTLHGQLKALLDKLYSRPQTILLVTDLEALHPYMRIDAIESQLYGSFTIPTLFFYPGSAPARPG